MTSRTLYVLDCESCKATYPPDGATDKFTAIKPLRSDAESKGWEVMRSTKAGADRCPSCRIRAIELAADLPRAVGPNR